MYGIFNFFHNFAFYGLFVILISKSQIIQCAIQFLLCVFSPVKCFRSEGCQIKELLQHQHQTNDICEHHELPRSINCPQISMFHLLLSGTWDTHSSPAGTGVCQMCEIYASHFLIDLCKLHQLCIVATNEGNQKWCWCMSLMQHVIIY